MIGFADHLQCLKRVKSVINGVTRYNVYDHHSNAAQRSCVSENALVTMCPRAMLAQGAPPPSNRWRATPRLHAAGMTLARIKNSGDGDVFTYMHPDHLGSASAGTNEDGSLAFTEFHTPFGEVLLNTPANDNQSDFTGHIRDKDIGLTYMQARYMDPNLGRFLSVDPVGFMDTGNPVHLNRYVNRYAYANNDPVNMIDPDGQVAGVAVKLVRRTIKHKGNVLKAGAEVGSDIVAVLSPSSTPLEKIEAAVALASPVDFDDARAAKRGFEATKRTFRGRKGGIDTRAQNEAIGKRVKDGGGRRTGGGDGLPEQHFPADGPGNKGGRFSDNSFVDGDGRPFQVQTVDTDAAGNITKRELDAAKDIAERSGQPVICIAKTSC